MDVSAAGALAVALFRAEQIDLLLQLVPAFLHLRLERGDDRILLCERLLSSVDDLLQICRFLASRVRCGRHALQVPLQSSHLFIAALAFLSLCLLELHDLHLFLRAGLLRHLELLLESFDLQVEESRSCLLFLVLQPRVCLVLVLLQQSYFVVICTLGFQISNLFLVVKFGSACFFLQGKTCFLVGILQVIDLMSMLSFQLIELYSALRLLVAQCTSSF